MAKKKSAPLVEPTDGEQWTIVQVASFLRLPYQKARSNMLIGDYGQSSYDAETKKLTVLASRVRAAKSKRGRKKKRAR